MALPNFPTLTKPPAREGFECKPVDDTISNETDGGYEFTRPRNSRTLYEFKFTYELMPEVDKELMRNFLITVRNCAGSFIWKDPTTQVDHTVRFKSVPVWRYMGYDGGTNVWTWDCELKEV